MLCPASMLGLWCWSSRLWGPWFSPQWTSGGSAKFAGEGREHLEKWCTWSHLRSPEGWRLWGPLKSKTNAWPTRPTNRRNHLSSLTQHESRCGRWSYQGAECHSERSSASDPTCFTRKAQEVQKIREKCSSFVPFICMNHFIFPDFAIGDDVPLFPVIYLCSPEPGGFGHHKFSGQSLPMSGQHSCIGRGVFYVWRGNVPPNNSEHAQKSWKQSARSSSHQWNSVMINDGWWKDGLTPFLRSLESLDSICIFVRCFCSKKSTKIILIVSLLGDRAEVSLLADDINKEPLSPDPCNIISFECREESWGWVICALFRGYNVIFAESMFVGLALGCTVPGICKSYQIVSSRTEKWLPISPENPSSLRRFCLGFVGSRLWYFTMLYIIIYHILVSHLHLLAPTVYTSTCITIGRGCVCREKCGMHEFLRSNTGTLCLIQLGNKLASLHMRAVFFLFCCMVSLLYALCIRK